MKFCSMKILIILFVKFININAQFAGGEGTIEDPYQIETVYQLDSIRFYNNRYFKLMNHLDFESTIFDSANSINNGGWVPIGSMNGIFAVHLDGQNYSIKNLYIDQSNSENFGYYGIASLFTAISGEIKNLRLEDVKLKGYEVASFCISLKNRGVIRNSCATGLMFVNNEGACGGLVKYTNPSTYICNSYTNIEINGSGGGIVWYLDNSTIRNCYSRGVINSGNVSGGLVGIIRYNGRIYSSYCANNLSSDTVGAIIGKNYNEAGYEIKNSFWDTEISGIIESNFGIGKNSSDLKDISTFTTLNLPEIDTAWDFTGTINDDTSNDDIWKMDSLKNDGYPYLGWEDNSAGQVSIMKNKKKYDNKPAVKIINRKVISKYPIKFEIFDCKGRMLLKQETLCQSIDISRLPCGLYFLKSKKSSQHNYSIVRFKID